MAHRMPVVAAAIVLAAGLGVAGCSSSGGQNAPGGGATATATVPASAARSAATTAPAASGAASAPVSGQAAAPACQVADLSITLGARTGPATQPTQVVDLTDKGSSACSMYGFPGLDLVGSSDGQSRYLPFKAGDGQDLKVTAVLITPPGTYHHATLSWTQPVLLQDAATHPGSAVTPVVPGR